MFFEEYSKSGAMYRGKDPAGKLAKPLENEIKQMTTTSKAREQYVKVQSITISQISDDVMSADIIVEITLTKYKGGKKEAEKLIGSEKWKIGQNSKEFLSKVHVPKILVKKHLLFEPVHLQIKMKKIGPLLTKHKTIGKMSGNGIRLHQDGTHKETIIFGRKQLVASIIVTAEDPSFLRIEEGSFYEAVMPRDVESMWGPGVNFINVLLGTFKCTEPKNVKKYSKDVSLFYAFGICARKSCT